MFEKTFLQMVTHILQKSFFKHVLTYQLVGTSVWKMWEK